MKKKLIIIFNLVALAISPSLAQKAPPGTQDPGYSAKQLMWIKESWTGDENPYKRTRFYIDKWVSEGQKPEELAQRYRAQAKDWRDPLAQYRWAYPAYLAEKRLGFPSTSRVVQQIRDALEVAELHGRRPRTYEYARLRFVAEALGNPNSAFSAG